MGNGEVWLPTAEDVIITKLRWSLLGRRSKDRDDARDVIAVQGDRIDWELRLFLVRAARNQRLA